MRFTLFCTRAPRLPANIVATASTQKDQNQKSVAAGMVTKIRSSSANVAAFGPAENSAVTGVGEPSYTSGVHTWKGAAATLNPNPTRISTNPMRRRLLVGSARATCTRLVEPVAPYTNAMPYRKNAVANEPSRKYFTAASVDLMESRRYPARM